MHGNTPDMAVDTPKFEIGQGIENLIEQKP
jgi:hypothetical protein